MNNDHTMEIDLVEVIKLSWAKKFSVAAITICTTMLLIGVSYLITPIYQAETVLSPITSDMSGSNNNLANKLGGLASIVGVGGSSASDPATVNMAIFTSRRFIRNFIQQNKLMPVLFEDQWDEKTKTWQGTAPTLWGAVNYFDQNIRKISINKENGMVTLSVNWKDPEVAVKWAEGLVENINMILYQEFVDETQLKLKYLNEKLLVTQNVEMRKVLYTLVQEQVRKQMLSNSEINYAYKTVDPAVVPEKRKSPKRIIFAILGVLLGGLLGIIYAWFLGKKAKDLSGNPTE